LTSDVYMLGIEPTTLRPRMIESLEAITRLLRCDGPVTMKTDWFELQQARLHLAPYTDPCFEIAVASTITPFGMIAAGQFGLGVLSIGAGLPGGPEAMANQWKIAEETAAKHGMTIDRKHWRIVVTAHIAEDDEQALREVKAGERVETQTYFEDTLGRPPGRADDPLRDGVKMGTTLVGSPETAARGIRRLLELSQGGFGGILFRAHEWANREQTMRSYELFARYVIPQFQGSLETVIGSNQFVRDNRARVVGGTVEAVRRAFTDHGRAVPEGYRERTIGARDVAG
jgi:limonene 1,2-monooxygenase